MNHLPTTLFITGVKMDAMASPVAGGSFADVYRGSYQGHDVAIKRIRVFLSNDDTNKLYKVRHIHIFEVASNVCTDTCLQRFYREALIWRQLRHPHILAFMGIDQDALSGRGSLSMVSSWMTRGTLMQYLKRAGLSDAIDHHALVRRHFTATTTVVSYKPIRLQISQLVWIIFMHSQLYMGTFMGYAHQFFKMSILDFQSVKHIHQRASTRFAGGLWVYGSR